MSDAWPRSRRLPGSSPPVLRSLPNSVLATPAKTMESVERAGTAMCVTALGPDTWDAPVKEVGCCFLSHFMFERTGSVPRVLSGFVSVKGVKHFLVTHSDLLSRLVVEHQHPSTRT